MMLKRIAAVCVVFILSAAYAHETSNSGRPAARNSQDSYNSISNRVKPKSAKPRRNRVKTFAGCYDINWATWPTFDNVTSTTGSVIDADGTPISISMSANYTFGSTPSIYTFSRFSNYPASIPNSTVPKTTWAAGAGGTTTMCFSRKVTNPVLLLASLGSTLPQSATLDFSIPYVVLYDGGNMVYNSSTRLTGTEGYAIIMFPGDFTCVTISSSTPENYTNLTWGIRPQPFAINVTDNSSTCGSTTVTASGGTTYKWNGGDTPNQATNTFHTSGTYLVTVTNAAGCVTSASKDIVVSTTIAPTISSFAIPLQSSPTIIDEANKTIALTMPAGTNLTALKPTITTPVDATVSPASGVAQNFTNPVSYTASNSCAPVVYKVTVRVVKTATTCAGASNIITGDTPAPTGSYAWQVLQGGAWVNAPGTITGANYQTSALANGTAANIVYSLRRQTTAPGGALTYDSFYDVTVQPAVAITGNTIAVPATTSFCVNGDPANILGSTPIGGTGTYTYQWQSSADNIIFTDIAGATAKDYDPAVISATTYYQRVVSSGTCNVPVKSNVITVTTIPATASNTVAAPAVTSFCSPGDAATLTGSVPTGGDGTYQYQWQSSTDNVTFTNITGATTKDYDPAASTVTTYYRRAVTSGACSVPIFSNIITITVTSAIANNTITAPSVTSFCSSGDAASIIGSTPTGGTGTYIFQWQNSTDNITFTNIPGATAKDYDPAAANSTFYYRRAVTSGVCNVPVLSNVVTISALPQPANVVLAPAAPICAGSRASLSVNAPDAGLTYTWYDSPTKANALFTGATFTSTPLNGNQTYYVEASNGTCTSAGLTSITIIVIPAPLSPAAVTNPVALCSGTPATLAIAAPQAGLTYKWYTSATAVSPVFTGPQFITGSISANTTYYVDATNATGCVSQRTPVSINILAAPPIAAQGATVCAGSGATLTATSTDNNVTIKWYAGATGGNSIFTGTSFPTTVANAATTYYAEAINNATGCVSLTRAAASIQLAQPLPAPVVTAGDVTATSVSFKWNAVPNATGYQVSIDNGSTFANPSSGVAGLTHTLTGLAVGQTASIIVRASGSLPCQLSSNSASASATSIDPLADQIYVANAFTPNGDGNNDIVYVHSENINTLKFYVYNQWGEMLFQSVSVQNGWDGTYRGIVEPAGVYVYYVQAIMKTGKHINKKGTITLIR